MSECQRSPLTYFFRTHASAGTKTTKGVSNAQHCRITNFPGDANCPFNRSGDRAPRDLNSDLGQLSDEQITILGLLDGLNRRAEHLHIMPFEHTLVFDLNTTLKRGLSAKTKHNTIRPFFPDYPLHKRGSDRQEIDLISQVVGSLDRSDVRIHKNRSNPFLL